MFAIVECFFFYLSLYRYLDPHTLSPCKIKRLLKYFPKQKRRYKLLITATVGYTKDQHADKPELFFFFLNFPWNLCLRNVPRDIPRVWIIRFFPYIFYHKQSFSARFIANLWRCAICKVILTMFTSYRADS